VSDLPDRLAEALKDRYALQRELGRGGMATVYLAADLKHERSVALKVLSPDLAAALGADRFLREIKTTAQLAHPHILPLLDSGDAAGTLFYVMPYVEGESLRDRLERERQLPPDDALRIAGEAARALEYAHQRGVIHRDIKPENILLTRDGTTLVADFGIARTRREGDERLTATGLAVGTPLYMSPEQATGDRDLDARSDVYALGAVLYEMLAGEPPFGGPTPQAVLVRALTEDPRSIHALRGEVSPALDAVVARALARDPAGRWPSMAAFAEALAAPARAAASAPRPAPARAARPAGGAKRLPSLVSRRPLFTVLALGILIGGGALFGWRRSRGGASAAPRRVAVLRFENTGGADQAYLAEGLGDELRSALTGVPGLAVKARGSSLRFRSGDADPREVGTKLDVETVLEASVGESGPRIHLVAELVNVSDGNARWSRTFDSPRTAMGAIQDSIVRAVAGALGVRPESVPEAIAARETQDTGDVEAYDLYLRGRHAEQLEGYQRAIGYYQQAVARNPRFARAWAALAGAYLGQPFTGLGSRDSAIALARPVLARADALDSAQSDRVHITLMEMEFRFADAERIVSRLVAARPTDADLRGTYAGVLYQLARIPEAIEQARAHRRFDPLSADAALDLQYYLYLARDFRGAVEATRDILELDPQNAPAWGNLGAAYAFLGRPDSAAAAFEKSAALDSTQYGTKVGLVWGYAAAGRWKEAEAQRPAAERQLLAGNSPNLQRATLHLAFGQIDSAATDIERSVAKLEPYLLFTGIPCDPAWDPLKSNPRFLRAVGRLWPRLCPASTPSPIRSAPSAG